MLVDTHCHLDAPDFANDPAVIERARSAGVHGFVVPAVCPDNFQAVRQLAQDNADVCYALGIHPLWTDRIDGGAIDQLEQALTDARDDPRLVAVGEIGLDFFVNGLDNDWQESVYRAQLQLAARFNLPVILHVRKSQDRLLKYLRQIDVVGGIAHAFNGSLQQAEHFIDRGFCLGFGGAMTYQRARQIRRLAAELPAGAHVLETDSPDIPPAWQGAQPNEPLNLPAIADELANIRQCTVAETVAQCWNNAVRVLPKLNAVLPEPGGGQRS